MLYGSGVTDERYRRHYLINIGEAEAALGTHIVGIRNAEK
jgi:hypothetical protein